MTSTIKKMVLFRVGERQYGINMPHIKNIQGVDDISESLKVPRFDLSLLFGENSTTDDRKNKKLILIEQNNQQLAFVVDGVDGVINAEDKQVIPLPPVFEGHSRLCFPWVFNHRERMILLINPISIIDVEDMIPAPVPHEPEPTPLEGLDDLEENIEDIPSLEKDDEINSTIPGAKDTVTFELKNESDHVPTTETFKTDTDEEIKNPVVVETPLDRKESSSSVQSNGGPFSPVDKDENLSAEITIEKSINIKKIEKILTRVVEKKITGKLKNIFDQALMEPRLRT